MKQKLSWFFVVALIQAWILMPFASEADTNESDLGTYTISDIVLTPGADASKMNFAWHTTYTDGESDSDGVVVVKVVENAKGIKKKNRRGFLPFFSGRDVVKFYGNTFVHSGAIQDSGVDENDEDIYFRLPYPAHSLERLDARLIMLKPEPSEYLTADKKT